MIVPDRLVRNPPGSSKRDVPLSGALGTGGQVSSLGRNRPLLVAALAGNAAADNDAVVAKLEGGIPCLVWCVQKVSKDGKETTNITRRGGEAKPAGVL